MQVADITRRLARAARRVVSPGAAGVASYRSRRFVEARSDFARAQRRGGTRATWLYAAAVEDRLQNAPLRDRYLATAQRRFPPTGYDFTAALAVSKARPQERDEIAQFAVQHAEALARTASERAARPAPPPRYAFVYWDSENRPDIVQHCIDSMRRHCPDDLTLVELDARTLGDWITIDQRIMDRVDGPAHAADMIRLHLLSTYGGMWIDASCLLNPTFPAFFERIRDEDLFLFTYAGARTGNWFIWARPDSYRLQLLRATLDAWFLAGRRWTSYFHFHDVVDMLSWTDSRYRAEWDAGLRLHPGKLFDCHRALGRSVGDDEWNRIRHAQPINKLSWRKYNDAALRADPTTGAARFVAEPLGERAPAGSLR